MLKKLFEYLIEPSSRRSCVSPPPAGVPDNPSSEKAYEVCCGSYLAIRSASVEFWRPNVKVPQVGELIPAKACSNGCPAMLESMFVLWLLSARPLFCATDLRASVIWPEAGLK